jgi:hypothetical protein
MSVIYVICISLQMPNELSKTAPSGPKVPKLVYFFGISNLTLLQL